MVLISEGKSDYVISLAHDAIPAERTAAIQLQEYLHLATGVSLRVVNENTLSADRPQIFIGAGKRVKNLLPDENWNALGTDGIVIKTVSKNLILAGGRPRGTLYAVFQFLEEQVGVRWWTPTEKYVSHTSSVKVPPLSIRYVPPFTYREHFSTAAMKDPLFATRMRLNWQHQRQDETLGGHSTILGWVHTFDALLPPQEYFKDHPEWYSDPANGNLPCTPNSKMPAPQTSQLNLGNEEMRAELTRNALQMIRKNPKNPKAGVISISQNDNNNWCRSSYELEMLKKEGSPAGALVKFVNAVAADIEKEFPDFLVETLAYHYTQKAPTYERPRRNVVIRLCTINNDFSRPFNSETNRSFQDDLLKWKAIAPRLYIWNYAGNFNNWVFPAPNIKPLGENLRLFARNNVIGVFEQGDAYSNGVGDFIQLRTWLTSKLLWNPFQDENELTNEFLQGYYGAAAPHLANYLDLIHSSFMEAGGQLEISPTNHNFLTLEVMNQATALLNAAQQSVEESPEILRRVRRVRLSLDHAWILRYNILHQLSIAGQKPFSGPANINLFVEEFIKSAREFGIEKIEEHKTFEEYAPTLKARFAPAVPLPEELQNKIPPGQQLRNVIDVQDVNLHLVLGANEGAIVNDPKASDHKAVRVIGATRSWVVQYRLQDIPQSFLNNDTWQCYAVVRVEKNDQLAPTGNAFIGGIYDQANHKSISDITPGIEDFLDDEYKIVSLGTYSLTPDSHIWLTSVGNNPAVNAVYVDRIILIRAP